VGLAMTVALVCLGFFGWLSNHNHLDSKSFPHTRYLSTSEIQSLLAQPEVGRFRFRLFQYASGARRLSGDLLEDRKLSPFVAPAEDSTMALLAEQGVSYETIIENRDSPHRRLTKVGWWSQRLLNPFCCFILADSDSVGHLF
jgi:hypothetical protein